MVICLQGWGPKWSCPVYNLLPGVLPTVQFRSLETSDSMAALKVPQGEVHHSFVLPSSLLCHRTGIEILTADRVKGRLDKECIIISNGSGARHVHTHVFIET